MRRDLPVGRCRLWVINVVSSVRQPLPLCPRFQGLVQVLEAAVTGLEPGKPYVLALSNEPTGIGTLELLQPFTTNPAGSAIVNAIGPIRQVVHGEAKFQRRYLVIAPGAGIQPGAPVQVQAK